LVSGTTWPLCTAAFLANSEAGNGRTVKNGGPRKSDRSPARGRTAGPPARYLLRPTADRVMNPVIARGRLPLAARLRLRQIEADEHARERRLAAACRATEGETRLLVAEEGPRLARELVERRADDQDCPG
jgi:hypothetical protein